MATVEGGIGAEHLLAVFVGLSLHALGLASLGLACSAWSSSQLVAAVASWAVGLRALGLRVGRRPSSSERSGRLLDALSMHPRYGSFAEGIVNLEHFAYFVGARPRVRRARALLLRLAARGGGCGSGSPSPRSRSASASSPASRARSRAGSRARTSASAARRRSLLGTLRGAAARAARERAGVPPAGRARARCAWRSRSLAAVALERAVARLGVQLDWTFERKFEPAPATLDALRELCEQGELDALLFGDDFDPRRRSTRLLLQTLAAKSCLRFEARSLGADPGEEDRYGVGDLEHRGGALSAAGQARARRAGRAADRGRVVRDLLPARRARGRRALGRARRGRRAISSPAPPTGYSGLASALVTEGYQLHQFVGAATGADPRRRGGRALDRARAPAAGRGARGARRATSARGGRLVALLEPGAAGGLEEVLARWGIEPAGGVVVDPASATARTAASRACARSSTPTRPATRSRAASTTRA